MLTIIFLLLMLLKAVTHAWAFQLHVTQCFFLMKTTCIAITVVYHKGLH